MSDHGHPHSHIPNYYVQRQKLDSEEGRSEKQWNRLEYGGGELHGYHGPPERQVGPRVN